MSPVCLGPRFRWAETGGFCIRLARRRQEIAFGKGDIEQKRQLFWRFFPFFRNTAINPVVEFVSHIKEEEPVLTLSFEDLVD